jgi:hypothetical protein
MDRKGFLKKTCIAGACYCGFGALVLNAADNSHTDQENSFPMAQQWLIKLLENLGQSIDEKELRRIVKMSAVTHYDHLKMDELLADYKGNLRKFTGFLEKEWSWKVDYDEASGVITADENKSYCVCPVLDKATLAGSQVICYCSEGFAELMFSRVAGVPVSAQVISSVRRGDRSCVYRIELPTQA